MISEKTVFILGAGASCPFGYPTGYDLKKDIVLNTVENLIAYRKFFESEILAEKFIPRPMIEKLKDRFENSRDLMIDYFLSTLESEDLIALGKMIIAASMVKYEKISRGQRPIQQLDDWFSILFTKMTEGINKHSDYHLFSQNNLSFISFNYDRSLEYLFATSLSNKFNIDNKEIKKLLENIKIFHVFGRLPNLPHESLNEKYQYGYDFSYSDLTSIANGIKTINERTSIDCKIIHDEINSARKIFILGFGFAKENLEVLNLHDNIKGNKDVFCTAMKLSKYKIEKLKDTLIPGPFLKLNNVTIAISKPTIEDVNTSTLLNNYLVN
jgi:hypothetical protein